MVGLRGFRLVGAAWTAIFASSAVAQSDSAMPKPPHGQEQAEILMKQAVMQADPVIQLATLDKALTIAATPSDFRGIVQCLRGQQLDMIDEQQARANAAFAECIALLPNHPWTRIAFAWHLLTHDYGSTADLIAGTDALLATVRDHPAMIREIPVDFTKAVIRRLSYLKDDKRIAAVIQMAMRYDFARNAANDNDKIITIGILAGLNNGDTRLAASLVSSLKRKSSLQTLRTLKIAQPIWAEVEKYQSGGLAYRQQDFDRSTQLALENAPDDGEALANRVSALIEGGDMDAAIALVNDQIAALKINPQRRESMEDMVGQAERDLIAHGRTATGLALGDAFIGDSGPADLQPILNTALNHANRLIQFGDREKGLALFRKIDQAWWLDTSMTEGRGAEIFMFAFRSCDTRSSKSESAFAVVSKEKYTNRYAYRLALICRADSKRLETELVEQMAAPVDDRLAAFIGDARRAQAGLPNNLSPAEIALLTHPPVREALDKVSVSLPKN